jgi:hypothetical protein
MPLGQGFTAEEQLGGAGRGGLQIAAWPLEPEAFERRRRQLQLLDYATNGEDDGQPSASLVGFDMGLAPGGRMHQEIFSDRFEPDEWQHDACARCVVRLCNSVAWQLITGEEPPTRPPSAADYERAGLPWFDYYGGDLEALADPGRAATLKGIAELSRETGRPAPHSDPSLEPRRIIRLRRTSTQVREDHD